MLRDTIVPLLREYFAHHSQGLIAAYLFGSVARGKERASSDVDIGVVLGKRAVELSDLDQLANLQIEISDMLRREVDLIPLDLASPDFCHHVRRDQILLHQSDAAARIEWEIHRRNEYFDLLPNLTAYRRDVLSRV